ncbi:hypothetical protein ACOSP6_15530 [Tenacibaculum sp. MEBiC06402]|uniref:hypothetical protein n=1 Tax=unclassified Tenacibaculum TaxID=2635139 RepID=UPI003B99AC25
MIKNLLEKIVIIGILILSTSKLIAQGPTAPEAATFEPVEASDMVNLVTGDFSYVLPLLEVPSPEGGYPLTLSNHAGIANNQKASWVGLGWNVNPGAINRSVSGFPDDWKDGKMSSIVYDIGGTVTSHSFNVGVGWGKGKYSIGLYASFVENKAFGGETTYSSDFGISGQIGKYGGRIGTNGIGVSYTGGLMNKKLNPIGISGRYSLGINHSFKSGKTSMTYSASINNNSTGTSTGVRALRTLGYGSLSLNQNTFADRSSAGGHSQSSYEAIGISLNFPIKALNIGYQYSKVRYWYFDSKSNDVLGTLYAQNNDSLRDNTLFYRKVGFDSYTVVKNQDDTSLFENSMILPAYDNYSVSGQGIGGSISPKIFEYGTLTPAQKQVDFKGAKYTVSSLRKKGFTKRIGDNNNIYFYFNDVNESYVDVSSGNWDNNISSLFDINSINLPNDNFDTSIVIDGETYDNFNVQKKRRKSGAFIETYTNEQILANPSLIYAPENFDRNRSSVPKDGIGAFKITAIDGKTYHYSMPVYQKERFSRFSRYDEDISDKFYEEFQTKPYATHWLLTGITGSDYVDNGDGKISQGDLGYWVVFDYGRWSDGYAWRTPNIGSRSTLGSKTYETGVKEVYYLNAIKTRTHTAFFVKSLREDEKLISLNSDKEYLSANILINKAELNDQTGRYHFVGLNFESSRSFNVWDTNQLQTNHFVRMKFYRSTHDLLKLDKILLIDNDDIPSNFSYSNPNEKLSKVTARVEISEKGVIGETARVEGWNSGDIAIHSSESYGEHYKNILDEKDILYYFGNINENINKEIEFDYDYSLARKLSGNNLQGRLTLKSVTYKGKKGIQSLPPYKFEYAFPESLFIENKTDDWGYQSMNKQAWSLSKITHPTGGVIEVDYEEDDYFTEAVNSQVIFKKGLKFDFYETNEGKLGIEITNEYESNINKLIFSDYFQVGQSVNVDIFACLNHKYYQWGCNTRSGKVDINNENIDVVSVTTNSVKLETTLIDHTYNSDSGLGQLYGTDYYYSMDNLSSEERGECPSRDDCEGTKYSLFYAVYIDSKDLPKVGGGLRVKQITTSSGNKEYKTKYFYNQNGFDQNKSDSNYKSSGITSYAPSRYEKNVNYLSELPPPMVMYNTVTVKSDDGLYNKYYFKTLEYQTESNNSFKLGNILEINKVQLEEYNNVDLGYYNKLENDFGFKPTTHNVTKGRFEIINNFSMLGKLLKHEAYNKKNQLVAIKRSNYVEREKIKQGINKETFNSYRSILHYNTSDGEGIHHMNITSKSYYPSVLKESHTYDHNLKTSQYFNKYDFNTGMLLESVVYDSKGKSIKTEIVPAYEKYLGMGSKLDNVLNKNMLSQTTAEYNYIFKGNEWKPIGSAITTWKDQWEYPLTNSSIENSIGIWRKHESYVWNGNTDNDGIYDNFVEFNYDTNVLNSNWKKVSETTRYNQFSQALEVKDVNDNYAATKMGDNYTKVIATANASYDDMYYSGAEYQYGNYLDGGIKSFGFKNIGSLAHTGNFVLELNQGEKGFETQIPSKTERNTPLKQRFKVSVWVKKGGENNVKILLDDVQFDFNDSEKVHAGNWVLLNGYINIQQAGANVAITSSSGTVILDDFRLLPVISSMTSYVYNEWDEVTHIIGANGLATYYIYDDAGRLIETQTELADKVQGDGTGGFKRVSTNSYNYKRNYE